MTKERVYAIGHPDMGPIKIGFTTNLPRRLYGIQKNIVLPVVILWTKTADRNYEKRLHTRFRGLRSAEMAGTEWYDRAVLSQLPRGRRQPPW